MSQLIVDIKFGCWESSKPKGRAKEVFREKCSFRKKLRGLLHEEFQPWAQIPARSPG